MTLKNVLIKFCGILALVLLVVMMLSVAGCSSSVEGKRPAPQVLREGVGNLGAGAYNIGAATTNTAWGFLTFGWGFKPENTLCPIWSFDEKKFKVQDF
ncbi:MAG: hypothetical protein ACP5OG_02300 [Candidatus Nanoarchaeia archaeon]